MYDHSQGNPVQIRAGNQQPQMRRTAMPPRLADWLRLGRVLNQRCETGKNPNKETSNANADWSYQHANQSEPQFVAELHGGGASSPARLW